MLSRRELRKVALIYLSSRALLFTYVFVAGAMTAERVPNRDKDFQAFGGWFWDAWARWDAGWYARVAERGYYFEGAQSDVVFFPLYPYLARWVGHLVGGHWAAGLIISNAALFGAACFVFAVGRFFFDEGDAERALTYLLIFPTSFFFSAYYSESLFLLTSSAALYFFLKERHFVAGACGMLAAMTRASGVALIVAFAISAASAHARANPEARRPARWSFLWLLLIPCGLVAFMLVLWQQVGDPLAFVSAQRGWGRSLSFAPLTLWREAGRVDLGFSRDLRNMDLALSCAAAAIFIALPFAIWREVDPALPAYSWLLIVIPLSTGSVQSMPRFAAVAFPAFYALAKLGRRVLADRFITATLAIFLGVMSLLFVNWYWAG